ncbi:DUF3306 domain-containing protein [Aliivibrio sp. S3MY1]|uniref:DUF3306 domain-containing protein n=1 Tax=unclassified Aliivibrio TaxID=2645654 RepID=UPI0023793586|nr:MULTISPECIES: DUF3306 domain-containing protein [unclassified Aliivibrio]MDD9194646.1 DUF3306 domain-containing protein [Aliivibrio sp. S3MY1]MDD9198514.1 DUF3306 domain-containing protein [Aliivibrio sp. S2MY1]
MSNFLSRWALRKQKVKQGEEVSDEPIQALSIPVIEASVDDIETASVLEEAEVTAEIDLPTEADLGEITGTSNVSQFMAIGVDKNLKKAALRKMFLNPEFAMEDEPNYSTPPKLDSETAAKLRDWMVEPVEEEEGESEPASVAEPLLQEASEQQEVIEKKEATNSNDNEYQYVTGSKKALSETKKTI